MNQHNWEQILSKAGCNFKEAQLWAPYFAKYAAEFKITTVNRVAAFVANIVVESQYLRVLRENLKYSAKGLAKTWPNRYAVNGVRGNPPNAKALSIAGNPVAIANHCYANRMGNGDEASGDGWKYAGKGPIQITGKDNYQAFFKSVGLPSNTDPEALVQPDLGARSAMWFWSTNGINQFADKGDFDGCCDKVNIGRKTRAEGDAHGYAARRAVYTKLVSLLKVQPKLIDEKRVLAVDQKEMEKVIAPEITWVEQDPDSEYSFDHVKEFTPL